VARLNIPYAFVNGFNRSLIRNDTMFIFLDKNLSTAERWETYGHELGHLLLHAGHQLEIALHLALKQEAEANRFAYLFCVPDFLLKEVVLEQDCRLAALQVSELFGVTYQFAYDRLEIFKQNNTCRGVVV